ncbi:uncharacterized protein LAJ45_02597 [Morchella importuna]|uniref:uncharacterized protein n=1 Tax=Morchella importuna TaxID=1174673 RepID=UPI001E8CBC90|nr:uncharacterized protein LAJ45_02597 [Morchella importuna]KAH8153010.1 hypothetical protein LAJ45_02597 [Morchella importuna]
MKYPKLSLNILDPIRIRFNRDYRKDSVPGALGGTLLKTTPRSLHGTAFSSINSGGASHFNLETTGAPSSTPPLCANSSANFCAIIYSLYLSCASFLIQTNDLTGGDILTFVDIERIVLIYLSNCSRKWSGQSSDA